MAKAEFYLIEDPIDGWSDEKTGAAIPFCTYHPEYYADDAKRLDSSQATLEQLAQLCDGDAEGCNAHEYVSAHRLLGAVLYRRLGRAAATEVMRDIAERRGLHSMNGLCGRDDSFADLGVGQSGRDWHGSYGP